ncbi:hypothetical protein NDU88_005741 [Pleurodeles waltl]|uniref:Uncharacterized protein n=1 Tax=Pleurodeles waltl TaxID=8319 RepID=A0AAV7VKU5_PLEWA|nr:hypothetical protein NDU88_005741 [Pleurodeles waltl]
MFPLRVIKNNLGVCEGPTLPQSDPPYPCRAGTVEIPDPDTLWSGNNQVGLPVTAGRNRPFTPSPEKKRTETNSAAKQEKKAEKNSAAMQEGKAEKNLEATQERKVEKNLDAAVEGKRRRSLGSSLAVESEEDTGTTSGTMRRSGGPGGSTPELRPHSAENVDSAGVPDTGEFFEKSMTSSNALLLKHQRVRNVVWRDEERAVEVPGRNDVMEETIEVLEMVIKSDLRINLRSTL